MIKSDGRRMSSQECRAREPVHPVDLPRPCVRAQDYAAVPPRNRWKPKSENELARARATRRRNTTPIQYTIFTVYVYTTYTCLLYYERCYYYYILFFRHRPQQTGRVPARNRFTTVASVTRVTVSEEPCVCCPSNAREYVHTHSRTPSSAFPRPSYDAHTFTAAARIRSR